MRKGKINNTETQPDSVLKVINIEHDHRHIEMEIDRHVKSIQSLITKLGPPERQKYYNGLLSHLLAEDVNYNTPIKKMVNTTRDHDYSKLSEKELSLIRELSAQISSLYGHLGDTMS